MIFSFPSPSETLPSGPARQPAGEPSAEGCQRKLVRQADGRQLEVAIRELRLRYQRECALMTVFSPPEQ